MKPIIILSFIFLFSAPLSAQNNWSFSLDLFPNYTLPLISNDGETSETVEQEFRDIETWKPSVGVRLLAHYELSEKISLGTGIGYQNKGNRTDWETLYFAGLNETEEIRFFRNSHYLEIPIIIIWDFHDRMHIQGGISPAFNLYNSIKNKRIFNGEETVGKEEDYTEPFRTFLIFSEIGFGLDIWENKTLRLRLRPTFQAGVLPLYGDVSLNRHFISAGLGINLGLL